VPELVDRADEGCPGPLASARFGGRGGQAGHQGRGGRGGAPGAGAGQQAGIELAAELFGEGRGVGLRGGPVRLLASERAGSPEPPFDLGEDEGRLPEAVPGVEAGELGEWDQG